MRCIENKEFKDFIFCHSALDAESRKQGKEIDRFFSGPDTTLWIPVVTGMT